MTTEKWMLGNSTEFKIIRDTINSKDGIKAAEMAVKNGHSALCGVDILLQQAFKEHGMNYEEIYSGTINAGSEVVELMKGLGYIKDGTKKCPEGCVAKSGILWKKPVI